MRFPPSSYPGNPRDSACFVGSKKTEPEEKCLKTIHLVHNASPSAEKSVHSQEGNGASSPG